MSNQITRTVSDSDRDHMTLALYRQLTPEEREQVNAYLAQLLASRYTPGAFSRSSRVSRSQHSGRSSPSGDGRSSLRKSSSFVILK